MKILILGVAAVQYDAIKLLKSLGHEVHAIARSRDGKGADVANFFESIDFSDLEKVKEYIKEHDIDLVYSVGSDFAIPVSCKVSEELAMPKFVSEETARTCNNKGLLRKALGRGFEGNVPFQVLSSIDEELEVDYPFILKPSDSQGQRGIVLVNNYEDFVANFSNTLSYSRSATVIIEKYIDGPEISVNGYMVDGKLVFCLSSDRETWEQYIGLIRRHVIPAKSISKLAEEKVKKIMERAAQKLGINNGPVYAQVKVEGDNPYIIEITPRLDGCHMWKLIKYSTGIDLLQTTFEHLLGIESEFTQFKTEYEVKPYNLRFVCQEPHTLADYSSEENNFTSAEESFKYYDEGDEIRAVNGKYDKIAYLINGGN